MRLAPILASILIGLAPCAAQTLSLEWPNSAINLQHPGDESARLGGSNPEPSQPIPEPSTLLLVGTGLVGVALTTSWRRRRAAPEDS